MVRDKLMFLSSWRWAPWISSPFFIFSEPARSQRLSLAFWRFPEPSALVLSMISWKIVWDLLLLTLLDVERINLFLSPRCMRRIHSSTVLTQYSVRPSWSYFLLKRAYLHKYRHNGFRVCLRPCYQVCPEELKIVGSWYLKQIKDLFVVDLEEGAVYREVFARKFWVAHFLV